MGETRLAFAAAAQRFGRRCRHGQSHALSLLLSPVVSDDQAVAVIEILARPATGAPSATEGHLRFLSAVCEVAADYDRFRQLHELREHASTRGQFDQFTRAVHGRLDVRHVAYTLANEGRAIIGCDRASVAIVRGPESAAAERLRRRHAEPPCGRRARISKL